MADDVIRGNDMKEKQINQGNKVPERKMPQGRTPQGRTPQGRTPQGRTPQNSTSQGRAPQSRAPQGRRAQGNAPQGVRYEQDPYGNRGYYEQDPYANRGYYEQDPRQNRGYYGQAPYDQRGYYGGPGYDQADGTVTKKKKKKKFRKVLFILELILLLLAAGAIFVFAQLGRIDREKLTNILINDGISNTGYRNIALFGVDSREGQLESGTNSDTIIVASINKKTNDVKLVSVYRDTYLDNAEGRFSKANSAYATGGAKQAIDMLNKNLDLDISDYLTVDFAAVIEAVDLVGGIELDITEEERNWLNGYLVETSAVTGVDYTTIDYAGYQPVTGIQAMAYCRIRYTEGWDFKRTERQRTVLQKVFEKAKGAGVSTLVSMVNTMIPNISTSMSSLELIGFAKDLPGYHIDTETQGFPFSQIPADTAAGDCVVPVNLEANVIQLHSYLFGDQSYNPSNTVKEISYEIINNTGIQ